MPRSTAASAEERLKYILTVLSYTDLTKPDYVAIKNATGQSSPNNAQKKFKAFVELGGFSLIDRQIIRPDGNAENDQADDDDATTLKSSPAPRPKGPKASPKTKSAGKKKARGATANDDNNAKTQARKKRKVEEIIELSDDEVVETEAVDVGTKREATDGEDMTDDGEDEDEQDRSRRSRARSLTMKAEDIV